ncbi:MAG: NAD-dependent epimerase/dehydratase family protein [Flavitalea sp.]
MHTILGAGGPVANSLTKELITHGCQLRLVSRKPVTLFPGVDWRHADLKNVSEVIEAVKGSSVIYMCAGLQYNKKIWAAEWPVIMNNIIAAARSTQARLIFFDNVYMYGYVKGPMLENTPYQPSSVKGGIRSAIATQLMESVKTGDITATIARSADFYGAESLNSFYDSMVLAKYAKREKAMWLGNINSKHSFTYIPDAGKAMYLLGQNSSSDNQVWHLPTAPALTGKDFINLAATEFHRKPEFMTVNKLMLQALGLFKPMIGETAELYYQYQYDYVFDSSKFEKAFQMPPTAYAEGIRQLKEGFFRKMIR